MNQQDMIQKKKNKKNAFKDPKAPGTSNLGNLHPLGKASHIFETIPAVLVCDSSMFRKVPSPIFSTTPFHQATQKKQKNSKNWVLKRKTAFCCRWRHQGMIPGNQDDCFEASYFWIWQALALLHEAESQPNMWIGSHEMQPESACKVSCMLLSSHGWGSRAH